MADPRRSAGTVGGRRPRRGVRPTQGESRTRHGPGDRHRGRPVVGSGTGGHGFLARDASAVRRRRTASGVPTGAARRARRPADHGLTPPRATGSAVRPRHHRARLDRHGCPWREFLVGRRGGPPVGRRRSSDRAPGGWIERRTAEPRRRPVRAGRHEDRHHRTGRRRPSGRRQLRRGRSRCRRRRTDREAVRTRCLRRCPRVHRVADDLAPSTRLARRSRPTPTSRARSVDDAPRGAGRDRHRLRGHCRSDRHRRRAVGAAPHRHPTGPTRPFPLPRRRPRPDLRWRRGRVRDSPSCGSS